MNESGHLKMGNNNNNMVLSLLLTIITIKSVDSIYCYQCSGTDSNNPFECNEFLESDIDLAPTDCQAIHDAQYCIKHVGRYEGGAIDCYQCNSSSTMECGDGLMNLDGGVLHATPCDHVYGAWFCIKQIGLANLITFNAFRFYNACCLLTRITKRKIKWGISTKRFCSSLDLGNYCNYVQQPGDKLEYRTCIYTCGTDGCNTASDLKISFILVISLVLSFKCIF